MKGKWIYFSFAALLGMLAAFSKQYVYFSVFIFGFIFLYYKKGFSKKQLLFICCMYTIFFVRSEMVERTNVTKLSGNEKNFYLLLQDDLKVDGNMFSAIGQEMLHKEKLVIRYKLKTEKEKELFLEHLKIGMSCHVKGSLEQPLLASNENAFNYREYLNRNGVFWVLQIDHINLENCSSPKKTFHIYFQTLRNDGISYVNEHFPTESAPLAIALLFGERNYIDSNILNSYQKLGIIHLLAISGLHVGMLAGMIFYCGIRVGISREKMMTALLLFLPCYVILTGAAPSVIRAVFMMMIFLALKKWCSKLSLLTIDIISIVFIVYSLISPLVIYHVGFQLSFCVSFSLILSAPIIVKKITHPIALLFVTSFICQLAATPILFYYFYEVSLIPIMANVIFIPLFSIVILPMIIMLFLLHLLLGQFIHFFLHPFNFLIILMDNFTEVLTLFPITTITLGKPTLPVLLLYIIVVPVFFSLWEKSNELKHFIKITMILLLVFFIHSAQNTFSPYGEITFIDVGQGDSILIRMPYRQGNYLIDTGGTLKFDTENWKVRQRQYEVGKDVVVPYLKSKGITTIDKLILTHGDMDHIGGAKEVIKEIKVKELMMPITMELSTLEKELLMMASQKNIPVQFTKSGDNWRTGDVVFQVLSPQTANNDNRNDGSIVLYTKIGGLSWLFTGDLEEGGEEKLIQHFKELKIDVLKVGHHGSKSSTSENFLDKTQPKIAVISAGKNNRYGHPNKEVLASLTERNIKVLRTDQHGAIIYTFKKDKGTFSIQLP